MHASNLACLFFALLVALFSALPIARASPAKPTLHRRFLQDCTSLNSSNSHARHLLQSCGSCPATATASATCSAAPASLLNTIRADLISKCSSTGFNPNSCCELYTSSNWNLYAACACSDSIAGLSAFVDGNAVMSACGCGPSAISSTTATTAPNFLGRVSTSTGGASTSSSVNIEAVFDAVSFSSGGGGGGSGNSGGNNGGRGSSSGSNSSSSTSSGISAAFPRP